MARLAKSKSLLGKKPKTPSKKVSRPRTLGIIEPTIKGDNLSQVETVELYNFYNANFEADQYHNWVVSWASNNGYTKDQVTKIKACPKGGVTSTLGAICRLSERGLTINDRQRSFTQTKIEQLIASVAEKSETKVSVKKSPSVYLSEKVDNFLAEIEDKIDHWKTNSDFSLYDMLNSMGAAAAFANAIRKSYQPLLDELNELSNERTSDLTEAYRCMSVSDQKGLMAFVVMLLDDAEIYLNGKKATRKVRKTKKPSTDKQISKVSYQKESTEYKLKSVDPSKIVGAKVLYVLNTKYNNIRMLTGSSLSVKGTTVVGFDPASSYMKRVGVKKIKEVVPTLASSTQARAARIFNDINVTANEANGRLGIDCILLRTF